MYPTLGLYGDYILHSRLLLHLTPLTRGTLVTAVSPLDPAHHVLKRVVGLAGDSIRVDPSGERVKGGEKWSRGEKGVEWVTVPKGHVWLAGDNMSNSIDSRDYGPVPVGLLRGKVVCRVWPRPRMLGTNMERVQSI
ncbi:mitochondrial inner membrane protease subunit 1 [Pseudohyphozyma bogoriensis]|nr:mitochondrial inner membrane protease subunit 1 [Pseudohyphozyma bogoriensis]